jgi:fucose permease
MAVLETTGHHPVRKTALLGVSSAFFTVGLLMGSWGPMIPIYATRTGETKASIGILLGVASGAGFLMVLAGGWLVARIEIRRVLQMGTVVIAIGMLGLAFLGTKPLLVVAAALAGGGVALVNLSGNQALARSGHPSAMTHNSIANTVYAFGAVAAPLLIALGVAGAVLLSGAACVAIVGGVLLNSLAWVVPRVVGSRHKRDSSTLILVWMFLIGIGGYVALEASIAGWLPTAVSRSGGSATLGAWAATIFYGAMTLGRLLVSITGTRLRPSVLTVVAMALVLFFLLASTPFKPYIGITIVGFMMAPVFPGAAVWLARLTPGDPAPTTWLLLAAQAGGTIVPPLIGYALQDTSIAFSLLLAPIALVSLVAFGTVALIRRRAISAMA